MGELRIQLKRSPIGRPKKHKLIIEGLGLRKTGRYVIRKDTPEVWGMLNKIPHLVDVEQLKD